MRKTPVPSEPRPRSRFVSFSGQLGAFLPSYQCWWTWRKIGPKGLTDEALNAECCQVGHSFAAEKASAEGCFNIGCYSKRCCDETE